MTRAAVFAIWLALGGSAIAAGWDSYGNARFGYSIDIPPGFSAVAESDNSDGGISQSEDRLSQLAVWGANLVEGSFSDDFAQRLESARADGWTINYRRETARWASWSGAVDGRIFYARAIKLCDDQAAYFLIEYPKARKASYDKVIGRLVKSLKNQRRC